MNLFNLITIGQAEDLFGVVCSCCVGHLAQVLGFPHKYVPHSANGPLVSNRSQTISKQQSQGGDLMLIQPDPTESMGDRSNGVGPIETGPVPHIRELTGPYDYPCK